MYRYTAIIKVILKGYKDELLIHSYFTTESCIENTDDLCDVCDTFVKKELAKRGIPLDKFIDYSVLCAKVKEG